MKNKKEEILFPIKFNGEIYYEKDCGDLFLCFYHTKDSLNGLGGVYMSEGMWVYPDDSVDEF